MTFVGPSSIKKMVLFYDCIGIKTIQVFCFVYLVHHQVIKSFNILSLTFFELGNF